jgi:acetyl esterase/lipase
LIVNVKFDGWRRETLSCGQASTDHAGFSFVTLLALYDAIASFGSGGRRVARDVAFGPNPRQALDIYAPCRKMAGPLPVVVFFYGGSWDSGTKAEYGFVGRSLAALGYVAVVADYRVLPEIEYPVFLEDCAAAVRWVMAHTDGHGGDPSRIALMGHSAGAYNAAMIALGAGYLGGEAAIRGVVGLSGPYDFYPFRVPVARRVFGAASDPEGTQPGRAVTSESPPMFLAHGLADKLVYPDNTQSLVADLRRAGVRVVETLYPGVGHVLPLLAIGWPLRLRLPVLAQVGTFLAQIFTERGQTGPQSAQSGTGHSFGSTAIATDVSSR